MPDFQLRPSTLRLRPSLVPLASLVVLVGLSVSLGLAGDVWGGPPAPEETEAATPDPSATPTDTNQDPVEAAASPEAELPAADAADAADAGTNPPGFGPIDVPEANALRARMEQAMAEIGRLAAEARADEDLVRATSILSIQDRANDVMDLGTSEFLLIRDAQTPDRAREFALEKLEAAALRLEGLADDAEATTGRQGPEEEADATRNESDEPRSIPVWDPTLGLGDSVVPPSVDGGWPPLASPIE